ncbi:Peptidase M20 domain-containing protein 2 [Leucoagaricus sp. SymC.cos]|nr:Peptidase M20 domain-containing protein 2 [Leucoagaricus sp. SymC.cos]
MCSCNLEPQKTWTNEVWRPEDRVKPVPQDPYPERIYRPEVLATIEEKINELSNELRTLSLDIHAHPELAFEEYHAHDAYTTFMKKHGWNVKEHHHLDTAWEATFEHGQGGRVIGVNSEMDALKGIGHACGHNLIGIAGVAISLGLRAAMEKHNISGKIVLLGTPAEEGGGGKILLLKAGAYDGMDVCLMCHPSPGPVGSVSLSRSLAVKLVIANYEGHTAHAALSPWEGRNALDAAVLAYNNISTLRQQIKPTHRVHGLIEGQDWAPNIVPDKSTFTKIIAQRFDSCLVRAPTLSEMEDTVKRVIPCFHAAALATGCQVNVKDPAQVSDIRQNKGLGDEVANIILNKYGSIDYEWGIKDASTDFGNVTYALPSLHPGFSIPVVPDGGNHTREFAKSATTDMAHQQCLIVSIALAGAGMRVLTDDAFFAQVTKSFEEDEEINRYRLGQQQSSSSCEIQASKPHPDVFIE